MTYLDIPISGDHTELLNYATTSLQKAATGLQKAATGLQKAATGSREWLRKERIHRRWQTWYNSVKAGGPFDPELVAWIGVRYDAKLDLANWYANVDPGSYQHRLCQVGLARWAARARMVGYLTNTEETHE